MSVSGEAKIKRRAFYNCPKLAEYGTIGNAGNDTVIEQDSFDLLQNILEEAGELPKRVPYEDLVTTEFSKEALK